MNVKKAPVRQQRHGPSPMFTWLVPALLVWAGIAGLGWLLLDWHPWPCWLAGGTVSTALLFGVDKLLAKMGARRIPERLLLGASLAGGVIGGWIGMLGFRHKTRHLSFWLVQWVATAIHGGILFLLWLSGW